MKLTNKTSVERGLGLVTWTDWTPTYSAGSGSLTTITTTFARYKRLGKLVHYSISLTITNAGTGAGALQVSTPTGLDAEGFNSSGCGREAGGANNLLMVQAVGTLIYMWRFDGSTTITTGRTIRASGWYRIA
jgi:hypothetical protein